MGALISELLADRLLERGVRRAHLPGADAAWTTGSGDIMARTVM